MEIYLALRRLIARPGQTVLLVAIVAIGIAAATTVFSVVDQLLLRGRPSPMPTGWSMCSTPTASLTAAATA